MPETRPVLSSLSLRNFKSAKSADLTLRPLTVLVGENSAGKSSVLQALFLLAQAVRARTDADTFPLNGIELEAGYFEDLLHTGSPGERIIVTLGAPLDADSPWRRHGLPVPQDPRSVIARLTSASHATWSLELEGSESKGFARIAAIEVTEEGSGTRLRLERSDDDSELEGLAERSRRLGLLRRRPPIRPGARPSTGRPSSFAGALHRSDGPESEQVDSSEDIVAADVVDGFPVVVYRAADDSEALSRTWLSLAVHATEAHQSDQPGNRNFELRAARQRRMRQRALPLEIDEQMEEVAETARSIFPAFREWVAKFDEDPNAANPRRVSPLNVHDAQRVVRLEEFIVRVLAAELRAVRNPQTVLEPMSLRSLEAPQLITDVLYRSVHYLGPLRLDPEGTYRQGHAGLVATLGKKGEYAVAVLHARQDQPTKCPLRDGSFVDKPLGDAVNYWLEQFGIASSARTEYVGRHGVELSFVDPQTGDPRHPTAVGVGASQILPVIVLCLLASPGELILMEQPELHLHPAPQQVLGDFLLGIARSGRQLVVETHSEYLINRLRLLVVRDDTDETRSLTQIWYGRRADGRTAFQSLEPNEFGSFDEWPDGFFDQGPTEAEEIVREAAAKRRRVREGR